MNLIIRKAKIVDPKSSRHEEVADLLIKNGIITKIASKIKNDDNFTELDLANLHVSPGWFDSSVSFGEPGFEDRETIQNGLSVAGKSGFTDVALQPNSNPILDNQSQINFVKNKAGNSATSLYPIGAFTVNSEGKDLAELFDMKNAGAIAFGDYKKNIDNANLLKIGLQYVQDFDALIIAYSNEKSISGNGVANEGIAAMQLGLKGIPNLAEEITIARNLFLLEYTGGKLHIPTISTAKSVELIKGAKAKGLQVSCSVAVHNLILTDEKLKSFDTRFKVMPPLRNEVDRKALIKALKNGIIDMITTDHNPIDIEHKKMEFDLAKSGTIGLESAFGALLSILPLDIIIDRLTAGKSIFSIASHKIEIGEKACLTFFNPAQSYTFTKQKILSKSKNSAFLGMQLKGMCYGIFNNNQLLLNND